MHLLVVEIVLGLVALRRGWRVAPALLVGSSAVALCYAPAGLASGVAQAGALVALVATCCADPDERMGARPERAAGGPRRMGSLYQI